MPERAEPSYVRDARSPRSSSANASRIMSANRAKDTGPELAVRRALWARGLGGYRLHPKSVPGRPDIAYVGRKVAVFVHGCFWHACPTCGARAPRVNTAFWREKFARNRARDARKTAQLEGLGWRVLAVWEHEVRDDVEAVVGRVERTLRRAG